MGYKPNLRRLRSYSFPTSGSLLTFRLLIGTDTDHQISSACAWCAERGNSLGCGPVGEREALADWTLLLFLVAQKFPFKDDHSRRKKKIY